MTKKLIEKPLFNHMNILLQKEQEKRFYWLVTHINLQI